jgi:hypothetical protein
MLSGFNTNIRHRGVLFHVQSEDSGREHPHIITHLYHGGTILHSERSSYADRLGAQDLTALVRQLMEAQHRAVVQRLRERAYDELIASRLGPGVFDDAVDTKAEGRPSETAPAVGEPAPAGRESAPAPAARAFGEGIVSHKPLDEVILNYLVENARKRKQKRP